MRVEPEAATFLAQARREILLTVQKTLQTAGKRILAEDVVVGLPARFPNMLTTAWALTIRRPWSPLCECNLRSIVTLTDEESCRNPGYGARLAVVRAKAEGCGASILEYYEAHKDPVQREAAHEAERRAYERQIEEDQAGSPGEVV